MTSSWPEDIEPVSTYSSPFRFSAIFLLTPTPHIPILPSRGCNFFFKFLGKKQRSFQIFEDSLKIHNYSGTASMPLVLRWEFIKENKKVRKLENKKTRTRPRSDQEKKKRLSFFLDHILGRVLVFLFSSFPTFVFSFINSHLCCFILQIL